MKILEIKDDNGFFRVPSSNAWKAIDEIDKDGLMALLNVFLDNDVEMDAIEEGNIANQAHLIIYKSIYDKFQNLQNNKSKFKDESDTMYLEAIQKYSTS